MSEVSNLLDGLAAGRVSIGVVAADFVTRKWSAREVPAKTLDEAEKRAMEDVRPIEENSWEEVESAYITGKITASQYAALFETRR